MGIKKETKLDGIKLKYGSISKEGKFIYAQLLLPLIINFRYIKEEDYNRLMRNFHFELNRKIYRKMGNTSRNFGIVNTPIYRHSTNSKSLILIELNIENKFKTVSENLPIIEDLIKEEIDYIKIKCKMYRAFNFKPKKTETATHL